MVVSTTGDIRDNRSGSPIQTEERSISICRAVAMSSSGWQAAQGPYSERSLARAARKDSAFGVISMAAAVPILISTGSVTSDWAGRILVLGVPVMKP